MKNIYKYFINNDNHIKNKDVMDFSNENSLTQGYFLSRTRKKFLRDLEFNLNHYNKRLYTNKNHYNNHLFGNNNE